jgi:hypothetical protein
MWIDRGVVGLIRDGAAEGRSSNFRCPGGVFPVLPSEASSRVSGCGALFAGTRVAAGALVTGGVLHIRRDQHLIGS